jgi:hypothetical protein
MTQKNEAYDGSSRNMRCGFNDTSKVDGMVQTGCPSLSLSLLPALLITQPVIVFSLLPALIITQARGGHNLTVDWTRSSALIITQTRGQDYECGLYKKIRSTFGQVNRHPGS